MVFFFLRYMSKAKLVTRAQWGVLDDDVRGAALGRPEQAKGEQRSGPGRAEQGRGRQTKAVQGREKKAMVDQDWSA